MTPTPAPGSGGTPRFKIFTELHDFVPGSVGLELGPLDRPTVPADPSCGPLEMRYLDLGPREDMVAFYASDPAVETDHIPPIHYWLRAEDGSTRTIAEAVGGDRFDFLVANHVLEHLPDVIGWLRDVSTILHDDGALLLTVPDRRYCFDVHRPATTVGQALQAYDAGDRIPSVRAVYDQNRSHVDVDAIDLWRGRTPDHLERKLPFDYVMGRVAAARAGEYVDTHVWTMTPRELVDLLDDLGQMELLPFTVDALLPTRPRKMEFHAVLRRLPRGLEPEAALALHREKVAAIREALPDESRSRAHEILLARHGRTQTKLREARGEIGDLRRQLRREKARSARLVRELEAARDLIGRLRRAVRRRLPGLRRR